MRQKYVPTAGQAYIFDTSTCGQFGGSTIFYTEGCYTTGWESQYKSAPGVNPDVAVIAQVDTFTRNNETAARGAVWFGTFMKSEGTYACDVAHNVYGKWRVGLDTVKADFSSNNNCAVQLATTQRIYFNGTSAFGSGRGSDPTGVYPTPWGNTLGDSYMQHVNSPATNTIEVWAGSTYRTRTRSDGIFSFNGSMQGGTYVAATTYLQTSGSSLYMTGFGNAEIYYDGTNIRATTNSRATSTILA
jgi:hypothetical protein